MVPMATPAPALPDVSRRPSRVGGVEDRYCSLFLIGRGGMGTVEVALERGAGGFERVVALKRLLPEQARDPHHKQMFLREARLAALLRHPNVVHAFAFGELYGELFLAMEYVEGETLARALATHAARSGSPDGQARTGLDSGTMAFILAGACDGLHAAHELRDDRGQPLHVVHRDVSPHNVMMAYDGHVKLLDFGVAKFDGVHETRTGEVKGKMAYMSPEQALGDPLDRRSDLYSVGAMLFECITGKRMWGYGTDIEVMRRIALEEPPRLDTVMPDAPRVLVELHARLVARDVARRPATAAEVARELRAFASTRPGANAFAVSSMMQRLFGDEIDQRRSELNAALAAAAPTRVMELRSTLDPGGKFVHDTLTEPVIVRVGEPLPTPPALYARRPPLPRTNWRARSVAGGALLLAVATAIVGASIVRLDRAAPAIVPAPSGVSAPSTEPALPTATLAPLPAETTPPTASSAATPNGSATPTPTSRVGVPPHGGRPPAIRAPHPPATGAPPANRPPDVDPTPF